MKKTFLLTLALGCASLTSALAANVHVYITGSTAFRANVYTACTKLFSSAPSIYYGDAAHGGAGSGFSSKTASWVMTGSPITTLTNIGTANTLTIHGLFTGSIQGIETVVDNTSLTFPNADGTVNGNCATYTTAAPTIGFSDSASVASPFPVNGVYVEEPVCVQPFVMCKSVASGGVANINNITWEQMEYGIPQGRVPLSAWTAKATDTNSFVYILERTKDSGTRRSFTSGQYYGYGDSVGIYLWDTNALNFYVPTVLTNSLLGVAPAGVVGAAGLNNANLNWGYGYVGGGDIATVLKVSDSHNQSISFLSIADASGVGSSNWAQVVSFNGLWPTTDGANIHGNTVTGYGSHTNDYSPITMGYYPCWGAEVLVHPSGTGANPQTGNSITLDQLGDFTTPGSFMGVFNAQTLVNGGNPKLGSIENEIELSKTNLATGIRLSDMYQSREVPGGKISPVFH